MNNGLIMDLSQWAMILMLAYKLDRVQKKIKELPSE
jgi:hypothetical protein